MPITVTHSDFSHNLKFYLDEVDNNETILVTRSNQRTAAVISQDKLNALLQAVNVKGDSLDYAIARDKLIEVKVLPDDPVVESNDDYWEKFKN